ncbi:hypothetical protein [Rubrolithibacter danxiaensis]|uniref:hypothetical protein n=1 Tax=Rubrolithibacter danxiaensis TaxID=3390805 RepID=UPI003BF8A3CB
MKTKVLKLALPVLSALFLSAIFAFAYYPNKSNSSAPGSNVSVAEVTENLEFDFDQSLIRKNNRPQLIKLAALMKTNDKVLALRGHADAIGEYVYNWNFLKEGQTK